MARSTSAGPMLPPIPLFQRDDVRFLTVLLLILFPFLARAGTNDGSILLINDTTVILTAVIEASDGTFLGQFTVQPGQQKRWTSSLSPTGYTHPGKPAYSLTPYTVRWQCPSEGFYSMCTDVSPGAMCRASSCPGPRFCSPKKEQKQEPASSLKKTK